MHRVQAVCGACGGALETASVSTEGISVRRLWCKNCGAAFDPQGVCEVCGRAGDPAALATRTYRSPILGTHIVRYCRACRAPSQPAVEFSVDPGMALLKWGCAWTALLFLAVMIVVLIVVSVHH